MQKIMFNEKFGLETAVLNGTKTMTRRQFYIPKKLQYLYMPDDTIRIYDTQRAGHVIQWCDSNKNVRMTFYPKYVIGEVVAIAQSYETMYHEIGLETMDMFTTSMKNSKGWNNKMFVKADLMQHHIRITNVKAERLQDISEEDCLKEGIKKTIHKDASGEWGRYYWYLGVTKHNCPYGQYKEYDTAKDAFLNLIDEVSGKGTWNINPYVWVYEFELID